MPPITYAPNDDIFYQEQYRDLFAKTSLGIKSAIQTVLESEIFSKSLGLKLDYQFQFPILVTIKVVPEDSLYKALVATAGWGQAEAHPPHELTLNIEAFIQNPGEEGEIQHVLDHEMAHMVLADFMGGESQSYTVPSWLNEGMAQSVTSEGHKRVSDLATSLGGMESMLISCQLDGPIDTFAHGEANFSCYPEYYLAVQRLKQIGGPYAVGKIVFRVTKITPSADDRWIHPVDEIGYEFHSSQTRRKSSTRYQCIPL